MNTDLTQTILFLLSHVSTNMPPDIAVTPKIALSGFNLSGYQITAICGAAAGFVRWMHVEIPLWVHGWNNLGGWAGIVAKFKFGNNPPPKAEQIISSGLPQTINVPAHTLPGQPTDSTIKQS